MATKYSLLTHLTWVSVASFSSGIKSRVSGSPVERSMVITLCRGAFRLVLTYIKDPWFVILYHSVKKELWIEKGLTCCNPQKIHWWLFAREFPTWPHPYRALQPTRDFAGSMRVSEVGQQNLEPYLRGILVGIYVDIFAILWSICSVYPVWVLLVLMHNDIFHWTTGSASGKRECYVIPTLRRSNPMVTHHGVSITMVLHMKFTSRIALCGVCQRTDSWVVRCIIPDKGNLWSP